MSMIDAALLVLLAVLVTLTVAKPEWRRWLLMAVAFVTGALGARRVSEWAREKFDPADDKSQMRPTDEDSRPHKDIPKYEDKTDDIIDRPAPVLTGDELDSELDELELRARRERERREAGLQE